MLNLQQTKLLSALISSPGATDNYDYYVEGYKPSCMFDVINEIEEVTGLRIEHSELLIERPNGLLSSTPVFRLDYENKELAESIYHRQIDTFLREGTPIDCLRDC